MVMIPCVCHQEISGEDTPNPKEMIVKLVIKNNNKKNYTKRKGGTGEWNGTEGIKTTRVSKTLRQVL